MKFLYNVPSMNLLSLPKYYKQLLAIVTDIFLCVVSTWLAFCLRFDEIILMKTIPIIGFFLPPLILIPIFWFFGIYKTIFRYTGFSIISSIVESLFIYSIIYSLIIVFYSIDNIPRSIGFIQPLILFFAVTSSRLFLKYYLNKNINHIQNYKNRKNILIYGAGSAGQQLAISIKNNPIYKVVGFLDDNNQLHNRLINNIKVFSPIKLEDIIIKKNVSVVILAIPSISQTIRNLIIKEISKYKILVKTLPSIQDIFNGRVTLSDIKDLNIEDLLNREQVLPDPILLSANIESKIVLVTGAGGSIGSELCRQIIKLKPKKLILLELSEFSLYEIYDELLSYIEKNVEIIPLLCDVKDENNLNRIFRNFEVNTIYHTAAYKHVPLVERNICEGVKNNVFGTLSLIRASIKQKISTVVFISSDKAVRPTNIMGASKRLAELCIQGIYRDNKASISTKFSIVRFGNVLESSGSVIPKFKKQIKNGGPITLTHPKVTRYFMTTTEAAQLVIQAGSLSKDCEIFVLDMGQSVKIIDLIEKMVNFSGLKIKNDDRPNGDIKIKIIGLRPGEKLYEELLIGEKPKKTRHNKIFQAQDPSIPYREIEKDMIQLERSLELGEISNVKLLLQKVISSYNSNTSIVDYQHPNQIKF